MCEDDLDQSRETARMAMLKQERRLRRQFTALARGMPTVQRLIEKLLDPRMRTVRLPLGILFIFAGFLGFLPVLGFWMLPLGLMLLAVDLAVLQPVVSAASIRLRRRLRGWWRRKRG